MKKITKKRLKKIGFVLANGSNVDFHFALGEKNEAEGVFHLWVDFGEDEEKKIRPEVFIVGPESEWLTTKIKSMGKIKKFIKFF